MNKRTKTKKTLRTNKQEAQDQKIQGGTNKTFMTKGMKVVSQKGKKKGI
jgi:hypothetical protein